MKKKKKTGSKSWKYAGIFTLTFKSVDKILWCYQSIETSWADLWHGAIYFLGFYKKKKKDLRIFVNFYIGYSKE